MKPSPLALPLTLALAACSFALARSTHAADPIINASVEQKSLLPKTPDGGLPPMVGVQNIQVFRAARILPDLTDGKGWTYNHHMDLAQWKGRMYLAWTNGEKDEDTWPAHELFISSDDGTTWSKPAELFPQGVSTSLRMYFFHTPNGRMLTIAGLRTGTDKLDEAKKGGAVVREIRADHTLGPVFTLIDAPSPGKPMIPQPKFDTAADKGFVEACSQLLANHTFLETQDYGTLLGTARMAVYKDADPNFGKAFSFFHRADGALVGIGKRAWTVVSQDEGKTWSTPVAPASIVVGNAKEWVQRTSDGKYVMIYNPNTSDRYPLVATTSDDGITFKNMRTIHGDLAPQRYQGTNRSIGAQYVRGISEWARDDTAIKGPGAKDLWIVYSANKEDIWVSRIPVPLKIAETAPVHDTFTTPGMLLSDWNTYSPMWGGVSIVDAGQGIKALALEDRDPYDYAKAERLFPESPKVTIRFQLLVKQVASARLEIDLRPAFGTARPVRLAIAAGKTSGATSPPASASDTKTTELAAPSLDKWINVSLTAQADAHSLTVALDDKSQTLPLAEPVKNFNRLIFRTGPFRTITQGNFPPAESDKPTDPAVFLIREVTIE